MRAALLPAWPGLAYYFGVLPKDIASYSPAELTVFLDALDQINARKG